MYISICEIYLLYMLPMYICSCGLLRVALPSNTAGCFAVDYLTESSQKPGAENREIPVSLYIAG